MNTLHLKYALEVEKTGSITQAAENLYMNQPNLSKAIKELEETLGFSLFKRTTKGAAPTPRGREFLSRAREILAQLDELESAYKPSAAKVQEFRLSIPRASYISCAFTRFVSGLDRARGVDVHLRETHAVHTIRRVMAGEYTLGIIRYPVSQEEAFQRLLQEKGLLGERLWEFTPVVVLPAGHPLAAVPALTAQALAPYLEIVHGDTEVTKLPAGDGPASRRIYLYERGSQFDLLHAAADTYVWTSPLPAEVLRREGLVQRRCRPAVPHRDVLIQPKTYRRTPLDEAFLQKLDVVIRELAAQKIE